MAFPQLSGHTALSGSQTSIRATLVAVVVLAIIVGTAAWRLVPNPAAATPRAEEVPNQVVQPPPALPPVRSADDNLLHLRHAEQQLVTAAEELATARRLLAALSPALRRSYLRFEKRRADDAWTASDNAQRAVEQALDDIKFVVNLGKD